MAFTTSRARRTTRRTARPSAGLAWGGDALAALLALCAPLWLLALRPAAASLLTVGDCAPEILPLAVAVVAWTRAPAAAILLGLFLGCGSDLASAAPWGCGGIRLGVLAAAFAALRRSVATDVPGTGVLLVGVFLLVERLAYAATLGVWVPTLDPSYAATHAVCVALLTTLLAPLAFGVASTLAPPGDGTRR